VVDARYQPLADRMRPSRLEDYAGQSHLLADGKPLRAAIDQDRLLVQRLKIHHSN